MNKKAPCGWTKIFVSKVLKGGVLLEVQFLEPKDFWLPNVTGLMRVKHLSGYEKKGEHMRANIFVVDGRHLLWRTSDAFSSLSAEINGRDISTGGVYGFLSVLSRVHQRYGGKVLVAWEGEENFRKVIYPDYKKREKPTEEKLLLLEEMRDQEFRIKGILRAMGVRQYAGINCEADDVIGRLSKLGKNETDVVIYSGDSDLRQLVNKNVFVCSPGYRGNESLFDSEKVEEKHGVRPDQIADLKALAGDSSDNIPGVKTVGEKTAVKLLSVYGSAESVVKAAKANGFWGKETWPVAERFKKIIAGNETRVGTFKELTTIKKDASMRLIKPKRDQRMVLKHLKAYKFRSLASPAELRCLMGMADG